MRLAARVAVTLACTLLGAATLRAEAPPAAQPAAAAKPVGGVEVVEDFEQGADRWELLDPEHWRVETMGSSQVLHQYEREATYEPPHRSP